MELDAFISVVKIIRYGELDLHLYAKICQYGVSLVKNSFDFKFASVRFYSDQPHIATFWQVRNGRVMVLNDNNLRPASSTLGHETGFKRTRSKALAFASAVAIASLAISSQSALAYTITNVFTASTASPDATTDQTGQSVSFTSLGNLNIATNTNIPNGPYSSIVGDAIGTFTANGTNLSNGVTTSDSGNSVYAAFQYDSNGFRLIGKVTTSSTGAYSQMNVIGVTPGGSVLGDEGRSSVNNTTTGILGNETWLSTPTAPGAATATDTYLGIFNSSTEYTATTVAFPATTETASGQYGVALAGGYAVGTSTQYAGDGNAAIGQVLSQTLFPDPGDRLPWSSPFESESLPQRSL
jgi:hypothetical protein